MGFRTRCLKLQNLDIDYCKLKEFEKMTEAERSVRPSPCSSLLKHVTRLMPKVPSLCPEDRNILISEDKVTPNQEYKQRGFDQLPPVDYAYLIPFVLGSDMSPGLLPSSSPASDLRKAPGSCKTDHTELRTTGLSPANLCFMVRPSQGPSQGQAELFSSR